MEKEQRRGWGDKEGEKGESEEIKRREREREATRICVNTRSHGKQQRTLVIDFYPLYFTHNTIHSTLGRKSDGEPYYDRFCRSRTRQHRHV